MADYYPLIARAISALDANAPGESRRALYERARTALIAQLRGVQPPLSESEITRERLALEEAVRKVESEAAQRAREASRGGSNFRRANIRAPEPSPPGDTQPPPAPRPRPSSPPPVRGDRPQIAPDDRGDQTQRPQRNVRASPPPSPRSPPPQSREEPLQPPPPRDRRGRREAEFRGPDNSPPAAPPAPGARGFRDIADADDPSRAAAPANRATRRTYANAPPLPPEFDRPEPGLENRGGEETPYSYDESIEEAERYTPRPQRPHHIGVLERESEKRPRAASRFPFKSVIAIGIVMILVGSGMYWHQPLMQTFNGLLNRSMQVEAPKDTGAPAGQSTKIPDRVQSSDQVAPVAQRVVLYEDDPSEPQGQGKQYVGTVVWRTEQIKASGNQSDIAVRADVEIPDRKFKMTMSFRRNTDSSLPASHTVELTFILPPDFAGGSVANVPGILMKSNEQTRGVPLAGLAVKVTDGFFLLGLSNVEADRARNVQLLKERSWFDVPLVYTNQRRAIIAIEKGAPGERAFNEAFTAWGE